MQPEIPLSAWTLTIDGEVEKPTTLSWAQLNDLPRAFRTPLVPLVPVLAVLACLWLMLNLSVETWLRFVVWMVLGVVVYAVYGRRHSRLAAR